MDYKRSEFDKNISIFFFCNVKKIFFGFLREVYWIEGKGNNYMIKVGILDGSLVKVIVNSGDLKKFIGLFYYIEKYR